MTGSPRRVGGKQYGQQGKSTANFLLSTTDRAVSSEKHLGVKETQRNQCCILKMLLIRSMTGLWNCVGIVSHSIPIVQPLELNRASSK